MAGEKSSSTAFAGPSLFERFTGENLTQLENAIQAAKKTPPAEWPQPQKKTDWTFKRPDPEKLEPLLAACKTLANELKIESSFLASRSALTAVSQHEPKSVEAVMEVSGMMRWQAELMMPAINKILNKN